MSTVEKKFSDFCCKKINHLYRTHSSESDDTTIFFILGYNISHIEYGYYYSHVVYLWLCINEIPFYLVHVATKNKSFYCVQCNKYSDLHSLTEEQMIKIMETA